MGNSYCMNILIEDAETLKFLATGGQWTGTASEGTSFSSTRAAFATAKKEPMGRFNIVWVMADTGQFINMDHGTGKGV
jgi:hypothetical protein